MKPLIIGPGERVIVAGRTGCGKTYLASYLMMRSALRWFIIDPKGTAGYDTLDDLVKIKTFDLKKMARAIADHKYVLITPPSEINNPQGLDSLIEYIHVTFKNVGVCVDELFAVQLGTYPQPGLTAFLTRGREKGQSFLGLMQRPAWVSAFCFTESDAIVGMALTNPADRKKLYEHTGAPEFLKKLDKQKFLWYCVDDDELTRFSKVTIEKLP